MLWEGGVFASLHTYAPDWGDQNGTITSLRGGHYYAEHIGDNELSQTIIAGALAPSGILSKLLATMKRFRRSAGIACNQTFLERFHYLVSARKITLVISMYLAIPPKKDNILASKLAQLGYPLADINNRQYFKASLKDSIFSRR